MQSVAKTSSQVKRGAHADKMVNTSWAEIIQMHDAAGVKVDEELRWLSQATNTFEITEARKKSIEKSIKGGKPFIRKTAKGALRTGVNRMGIPSNFAGLALPNSVSRDADNYMNALAEATASASTIADKESLASFREFEKHQVKALSKHAIAPKGNVANQVFRREKKGLKGLARLFAGQGISLKELTEAMLGSSADMALDPGSILSKAGSSKITNVKDIPHGNPNEKIRKLLRLALDRAGFNPDELAPGTESLIDESITSDKELVKRERSIAKKWIKGITKKAKIGRGYVLDESLFSPEELRIIRAEPAIIDVGKELTIEQENKAYDEQQQSGGSRNTRRARMTRDNLLLQEHQRMQGDAESPVERTSDAMQGRDINGPQGVSSKKAEADNIRRANAAAVAATKKELKEEQEAIENLAKRSQPAVVKPKTVRAPRIPKNAKKQLKIFLENYLEMQVPLLILKLLVT